MRSAPGILLAAILAGCAGVPAYTPHPEARWITPIEAQGPDRGRSGPVEWGGIILDVRNRPDSTEIEVLAYPLNGAGRPATDRAAEGRFIAVRSGFLEPAEYAPGRQLTVYGPLTAVRRGTVGDAPYRYPTVRADGLFLWPPQGGRQDSNVRFGVGVGIGL
jgi:outer membrane lipoprotein